VNPDPRGEDLGAKAQALAEERLEACMEAIDDFGAGSPASAPFCGCTVCCVREVLDVAWAIWMEGHD
jgi:hypothetical protein